MSCHSVPPFCFAKCIVFLSWSSRCHLHCLVHYEVISLMFEVSGMVFKCCVHLCKWLLCSLSVWQVRISIHGRLVCLVWAVLSQPCLPGQQKQLHAYCVCLYRCLPSCVMFLGSRVTSLQWDSVKIWCIASGTRSIGHIGCDGLLISAGCHEDLPEIQESQYHMHKHMTLLCECHSAFTIRLARDPFSFQTSLWNQIHLCM